MAMIVAPRVKIAHTCMIPNNKYQGPKPKGLSKGSSSSAGAATVVAATCLATQAKPASGFVASSHYRLHSSPMSGSATKGAWGKTWGKPMVSTLSRGQSIKPQMLHRGLFKSCKSKSKRHARFPRANVFERAVKVFPPLLHASTQSFHRSTRSFS